MKKNQNKNVPPPKKSSKQNINIQIAMGNWPQIKKSHKKNRTYGIFRHGRLDSKKDLGYKVIQCQLKWIIIMADNFGSYGHLSERNLS